MKNVFRLVLFLFFVAPHAYSQFQCPDSSRSSETTTGPFRTSIDGDANNIQFGSTLHPDTGIYFVAGNANPIVSIFRAVSGVITGTITGTPQLPRNWMAKMTILVSGVTADASLNGTWTLATYNPNKGMFTTTDTGNHTMSITGNDGNVALWNARLGGFSWIFNRFTSSTSNPAQRGTFRLARRDAWIARAGTSDYKGLDVPLLRGGTQLAPTNSVGMGAMSLNGPHSQGATLISIRKAAGDDWSATPGDYIAIVKANGNADIQLYQIVSSVTVVQGSNTNVRISPGLLTLMSGAEVVVASGLRAQIGDAFGAETAGPMYSPNFSSTVPTGTQPYATLSKTLNTNLNADLLDGHHAGDFLTAQIAADWNCTTGPCEILNKPSAIAPAASPFESLPDGPTITWDTKRATVVNAKVILGGNRTLNVAHLVNGGDYTLLIVQDSLGARTLKLGSGCSWMVINGGHGTITLSAAANAADVLTFRYDGAMCYAALARDYN